MKVTAALLTVLVLLSIGAAAAQDCPKTQKPVCGANGVTYNNECLAQKSGTTVKYSGTCAFPTWCAIENNKYNPVCSNGRTYANSCVAQVNAVTAFTAGYCKGPTCIGRAVCSKDSGCNAPHKCKGDPKYTCTTTGICDAIHVLSNGKQILIGSCKPVYAFKATGIPAAPCYA